MLGSADRRTESSRLHVLMKGPQNSHLISALSTMDTVAIEDVVCRDGGHEQMISNGRKFKPDLLKRDKKQTMIDRRGIPTDWFQNKLCPSMKVSRLWALESNAA